MAEDSFTSDNSFVVPDGNSFVVLDTHGASGGNGSTSSSSVNHNIDSRSASGGSGGFASGDLNVTGGETLYIRFPGGGGGGSISDSGVANIEANGGGGGSGADVRQNGTTQADIVIASGGGGGGGAGVATVDAIDYDAAAGLGGDDEASGGSATAGGGTITAGGGGGANQSGTSGASGATAKSGLDADAQTVAAGGGGGGGDPGGGGGGADESSSADSYAFAAAGGGGGGGTTVGGVTNATETHAGSSYGGGRVLIKYSESVNDLSAAANTEDELDLSWADVSGEDNHDVLRALTSGTTRADYTQVATNIGANSTSYTDTALTDGRAYFYRLDTKYSPTDDVLSNEATTVTILPATGVTSTFDAAALDVTLTLTKTDDNPDGDWEIYRSTDGTLGTLQTTISDFTNNTYTDTGISVETTYYYTIRRNTPDASTDAGHDVAVPASAGNFGVTGVTGDNVDLSWTDNSSLEDGYRVYASRDDGATWSQVGSDLAANTTSFTTPDLLDGERYRFVVAAFTTNAETYTGAKTL